MSNRTHFLITIIFNKNDFLTRKKKYILALLTLTTVIRLSEN